MSDTFAIVLVAGFAIFFVGIMIYSSVSQKRYMNQQKETGEDKRAMLDLMAQVMEGAYADYTYMVGYFTKTTQSGRTTTYYYFPYILAFNASEMIIFPFIKKEGKLYIRNRLPVDWGSMGFIYTVKKKLITLKFSVAGDTVTVNTNPVIVSGGVEKSDRPLCVYQEQEYEQLKTYLPQYKGNSGK